MWDLGFKVHASSRWGCWVLYWGVCSEVKWEGWEARIGPEGKGAGGDLENAPVLYPQTKFWVVGWSSSTGCGDLGRRTRLAD